MISFKNTSFIIILLTMIISTIIGDAYAAKTNNKNKLTPIITNFNELPNSLQKNISATLININDFTIGDFSNNYIINRVKNIITQAVQGKGYYQAKIDVKIQNKNILINIQPESPVKLDGTYVSITGSGSSDFDLILKDLPKSGEVLDFEKYEDIKKQIRNKASTFGYANGVFKNNSIYLIKELNTAWWEIHYETGNRFKIGNIEINSSQINKNVIANLLKIKTGDYYDAININRAAYDLNTSRWYSTSSINSIINKDNETIDLIVNTSAVKRNQLALSLGYSTYDKLRGKISWSRPWVNSYGHSYNLNLGLSLLSQKISLEYKVPLVINPIYRSFNILYDLDNSKSKIVDAYDINSSLEINYSYYPLYELQYSIGIVNTYSLEHRENDNRIRSNLIYLQGIINYNFFNNIDNSITREKYAYVSLNLKSNEFMSKSIKFTSLELTALYSKVFYTKHHVTFSTKLGKIWSNNFDLIPNSLRFFSGGENSLRGYRNNSIPPNGADKRLELSLGYQYNIYSNFWLGSFYDRGVSTKDKINFKNLYASVGIITAYQLPFGSIYISAAHPIKKYAYKDVIFYFGIQNKL